MKNKILIFLLSFVTFSIVSCDDNDETKEINNKKNPIEGKWTIQQIGEIQTINNTNIIVYEDYQASGTCENDFYIFNADFTYSFNEVLDSNNCTPIEVEVGEYEIGEDTITLYYSVEENGSTVDYQSSATVINLTYETMELALGNDTNGVSFLNLSKQ